MVKLTFEFPDQEAMKSFIFWLCYANGEHNFWMYQDMQENKGFGFNYHVHGIFVGNRNEPENTITCNYFQN